ncbi:hypothetical protein CPB83DRAFT_920324 [Crepidotus variabilis]|uniref:DUF6532 domain-containing protein n=1 Tax=Crepidotus variabilis TaxID=179855 RepID=A0A9P6JIH4_9AGAR|nr:hypothetical protein CPB83DRAFT_920324 [Crepidotus variabilis]
MVWWFLYFCIDLTNTLHLEIDEQSPSEDERQALAVIAGPRQPQDVNIPSTDVVEEHRRRNHATKPPSEERLIAAAKKQLRQSSESDTTDTDAPSTGVVADVDEESERVQQRIRAARNSNSSIGPNANTQRYYPDMWKAAIGEAKILFWQVVALERAFPTKEADLGLASQCLSSIIAEFEGKGLIFELNYQQNRTMDGIVFSEGTTYRGKLKTLAAQFVKTYYKEDLNTTTLYENQNGQLADIAANVEKLIGIQNMFHKDGTDELGKTNNFMHPCIRDLCIEFFYSKKQDGLAHHFPDEFKDFVPERAVALVITAVGDDGYYRIRCALDEYRSGRQVQTDFKGDAYLKVYQAILQMIAVLNSKPHHQAKWKECRQQWASVGWAKDKSAEEAGDPLITIDVD